MKIKTAKLCFLLSAAIATGMAFSFLFLSSARAGDNIWTTTGPYGVRIMNLVIDPTNSQTIYASTPDGPTSVYKSTDGGDTWLPSSNGIPDYAGAGWNDSLVIDPGNSNTLYVATEQGVYKSTDAGQTWTSKSTLGSGSSEALIQAWSVTISANDGTLFAGGYDNPMGGGAGGGIFRSSDGGESWERLGNGAPSGSVRSLTTAPSAPHILYAGGDSGVGIVKSVDGGNSWHPIDTSFAISPDVASIAVDPYDAQVAYLSTAGQGIYKTVNGGQQWTPIGSGLDNSDVRAIAIDPGNQQVIYVGGGPDTGTAGVYRSLDNEGLTWTAMMEGMGSRAVWSLAMDHNDPQNIYAGTASGIWKYTLASGPADYSVSINDGALFTSQTAVTLTLTAPAGTSEVMISNDGGFQEASWEPFNAQKAWEITAYGDHVLPRVVYARFKTHGQVSGLYQDDIVLDVTAPTGSVQITNPTHNLAGSGSTDSTATVSTSTGPGTHVLSLPVVMNNYRPGMTQVGLLLSATDDLSGVAEMLIGDNENFAGASWESYSPEANVWLSDAETLTAYVRFRDAAGNESTVYSDSVTQAP